MAVLLLFFRQIADDVTQAISSPLSARLQSDWRSVTIEN